MARPDRGDPDDPLRILSDRLGRASEATERLLADAAAHVAADAVGRAGRGGAAGGAGGAGADAGEPAAAGGVEAGGAEAGDAKAGDAKAGGAKAGGAKAGGAEAGDARAKAPKPPPAGWQQAAPAAGEDDRGPSRTLFGADADLIVNLLATVRDRIPLDLQRQLTEAVRELLLALRALIDWYLERSKREAGQPVEVRDIPIL